MNSKSNPPLASTRAELRNLRNNSQATIDELRAFLAEMKGRSPQEMLGMVAGNRLFRATLHSCALVLAIIAVGTVVPYLNRGEPKPAAVANKPAVEPETAPEVPEKTAKPDEPAPGAIETLGVGEEKQAPRDVNPLETGTGGFLDELE